MKTPYYPNHGSGSKSMPTGYSPPSVRASMPGRTGQKDSHYHTNRSGGHPVARYPMEGAQVPKLQKTAYPRG